MRAIVLLTILVALNYAFSSCVEDTRESSLEVNTKPN